MRTPKYTPPSGLPVFRCRRAAEDLNDLLQGFPSELPEPPVKIQSVLKLIEQGALSTKNPSPNFDEILGHACKHSFEIFSTLLEYSSFNEAEHFSYALNKAAAHNKLDNIKLMVDFGANVNNSYSICLRTAAQKGHLEIVKYLIESGSDPTLGEPDTAIFNAFHNKQTETAHYLVEYLKKSRPANTALRIIDAGMLEHAVARDSSTLQSLLNCYIEHQKQFHLQDIDEGFLSQIHIPANAENSFDAIQQAQAKLISNLLKQQKPTNVQVLKKPPMTPRLRI